MFNDWSLGIILLDVATGRNMLLSVIPPSKPTSVTHSISSHEINVILVRMLKVDWRKGMTLRDVRYAIQVYFDGVVFEGSMAHCAWEVGMEIGNASSSESTPTKKKTLALDRPV